jgi:Ca-activated chloride channel family protein
MPEPDTMPPCNNRVSFIVFFFLAMCLLGFDCRSVAQATQPAGAQSTQVPETQRPLNSDHDPVLSPDPEEVPKPAPKQSEEPGTMTRGSHGQYTLERNVDEVVLNATVMDDKQHLVTNLTKDDFRVFEDGVAQTINSFQHQDIPISLGILVDNSGSMRTKREAVNKSALDLVHYSNPEDESFVVNFSDEAYIDQDFTASIPKLREGLSHIDSKGGTALYDAVVASADYLTKNAKRTKQVLLVITDGEDNASSTTLEETVHRIQDLQGPVVYAIGLLYADEGGGREIHRARRALEMLANETGGVSFFPKNLNQVDEIAAEVARDIREQYTIGYHSTKPASLGGFRTIHVDAKAKGYNRLIVRTRTGYYPNVKSAGSSQRTAANSSK